MRSIMIIVRGLTAETDGEVIVCGNAGDCLLIAADRTWSAGDLTVTMLCFAEDGTQNTVTVTAHDGFAALPVMRNAYFAEISVSQGDRRTVTPAYQRFLPCITDGDAAEYTPEPDIYNLMTEYIATRDSALLERIAALRQKITGGFPGDGYRRSAAYGARPVKLSGSVTFPGGTVRSFTDRDIAENSLEISAQAVPDDFLLPGGVPAAELKLTLFTGMDPEEYKNAEISLTYCLQKYDAHWCEIPLGVYTVTAAEEDTGRGAAVTAYDDLHRFDHVPFSALGFVSGQSYSPQEIITICAEKAGVIWEDDVSAMPNAAQRYCIADADSSMETARDVLMNTVQTLCAFAYADRFRKLRVRPLQKTAPAAEFGPHQRKSAKISRLVYRLYELTTEYQFPDGDSTEREEYSDYSWWANGVSAVLQSNPLWTVLDAEEPKPTAHQCLLNIINALDPLTYQPFEAEVFGDPALNLTDWLTIRSSAGSVTAPLTSYSWKYGSGMTCTACGTEAVAGIARTQAEKAGRSSRSQIVDPGENVMRYSLMHLIRETGHSTMRYYSHAMLAHFLHGELSGEE